jgi:MFS transporter, DHA1 family, tetracycline resistance protein
LSRAPVPPAIYFLIATIAINAIGFGIIVPVVPSLIMELTGKPIHYATAMGGWLSLIYAAFQFVFSPIMGNLSDRYGRRPVIIASMAGFSVDFLALALAPNLMWLFVARAFAGIFGASNAPAQSAIADLVPPDERSRYFGMLGAAFGIGFVLGPMIGGLLGQFGPRVPFMAAAVLAAGNAIFGLLVLPETLKSENRRPFEWRRANPVGALLHVRTLPGIVPISAVYLLWQVASLVYPMIWPYFVKGRYGWTDAMVGASLAVVGLALAMAQIFVLVSFRASGSVKRHKSE